MKTSNDDPRKMVDSFHPSFDRRHSLAGMISTGETSTARVTAPSDACDRTILPFQVGSRLIMRTATPAKDSQAAAGDGGAADEGRGVWKERVVDFLGTVRYRGTIDGQQGTWLGIEWDDASRGKHDGAHKGTHYFTVR